MKMNEEATFAVYQKKLKGICEENDLQATFNRSGYPLTMTVRPLQDVAGQMSMLEKVEDNGYTSPDASIKFSYEDGAIKYTLSKEFVISDAAYNALVNSRAKSYRLDDRELTRFDLDTLSDEIEDAERKVEELTALLNGQSARKAFGVIPRDW